MEMKHLIFFKTVAELEHMTKAAKQLDVAQPFISKTITELETELGVPLFDHVGRRLRRNSLGKLFYTRVQAIFFELHDAKKELADLAKKREHSVSIITNASLYKCGLLSQLKKQIPDIDFHQTSARRDSLIQQLCTEEIDFAICAPLIPENDQISTISLIEETCPIIYPPGHWLDRHDTITLRELENEDFITALPGYGIRELADRFFSSTSIHPRLIIETSDTSSIPNYIKNGLGIAFSPLSPLLKDPLYQNGYLRYIEVSDPPCITTIGLSWKKNRYLTHADKQFLEFTLAYFAGTNPQIYKNKYPFSK